MLHFGEFSAWITVDDVALPTFAEEILENGSKVTCWVPCQVDKTFSVHWEDTRVKRQLTDGRIRIDGNSCGSRTTGPHCKTTNRDYVSVDHYTTRPFVFSRLQLTEDEGDSVMTKTSQHIGNIELSLKRVSHITPSHGSRFSVLAEVPRMYERSKKAISHCVKFGDEVKRKKPRRHQCNYLDKKPFVTFIFKYRAPELLQANGIMPHPKEEKTLVGSSTDIIDIEDDNDDHDPEIQALQNKLDALRKAKRARREPVIKSEDTGFKRVKLEPSQAAFTPGEVIDLT